MATKKAQHLVVAADPERYARKLKYNRDSYQRRKAVGVVPLKDPVKVKARQFIGNRVYRGKIERPGCVICSAPNAHAHHEDYSKPLEVVWLCQPHHAAVHRQELSLGSSHIVTVAA